MLEHGTVFHFTTNTFEHLGNTVWILNKRRVKLQNTIREQKAASVFWHIPIGAGVKCLGRPSLPLRLPTLFVALSLPWWQSTPPHAITSLPRATTDSLCQSATLLFILDPLQFELINHHLSHCVYWLSGMSLWKISSLAHLHCPRPTSSSITLNRACDRHGEAFANYISIFALSIFW